MTDQINQWMNDEGDCRTAPPTPVLLIRVTSRKKTLLSFVRYIFSDKTDFLTGNFFTENIYLSAISLCCIISL